MPAKSSRGFRSLADQLADLEDPTPQDFDPEDPDGGHPRSDDDSGSEVDENAGREHYEKVGKSKLRKPETLTLGKEYAGSRVSRDALDDVSNDNDPFQIRDSDEDDEDDDGEEEEEDEEDMMASEEDEEHTDDDDEEEDNSDLSDGENASEDLSASDEDDIAPNNRSMSDDRAELRQLMATDQKTVAATISQAAKADATKGLAVRQQRVAFDALLNARIKLQKGLTAMNNSDISWETEEENSDAMKSAESAALALWSTLEELRVAIADVQSNESAKKRKRLSPVSLATSNESLWQRMQDLETESQTHRRAVLEKWNHKVRGTSANLPNARGKLLANSDNNSIIAVLEAHVAAEKGDRGSKKQRTESSESGVYDDAAFYQSLLRDLVEQRMSSSDAVTNGLDSLHLQLPAHPASGMRKDKVHKDVDTKASKGRKMRYNVHEKLQNFMAPEDRGTWGDRARDEFFASLLGRTASGLLGEADAEDEVNGLDGAASDEEDLEEGGLRLFRS